MLRYGHPQCTPPTSKSNCNGMAAPSASSTIKGRIIPIFKIVFPGHLELWWLWAAILEKLDTTLNWISQLSRRPWWFRLSHRRSTGRTASPTCLASKKLLINKCPTFYQAPPAIFSGSLASKCFETAEIVFEITGELKRRWSNEAEAFKLRIDAQDQETRVPWDKGKRITTTCVVHILECIVQRSQFGGQHESQSVLSSA